MDMGKILDGAKELIGAKSNSKNSLILTRIPCLGRKTKKTNLQQLPYPLRKNTWTWIQPPPPRRFARGWPSPNRLLGHLPLRRLLLRLRAPATRKADDDRPPPAWRARPSRRRTTLRRHQPVEPAHVQQPELQAAAGAARWAPYSGKYFGQSSTKIEFFTGCRNMRPPGAGD